MKASLILARTDGGCTALIVNNVVVAKAETTAEIDQLVVTAATQLSAALRIPLVECVVEVPDALDGKWVWADLIPLLPPVEQELAKHPLVAYCWEEEVVHHDTYGPEELSSELCFDTNPPIEGTPFTALVPVGTTREDAENAVSSSLMDEFSRWLNDRRMADVSEAFHDIVAKVETVVCRNQALTVTDTGQPPKSEDIDANAFRMVHTDLLESVVATLESIEGAHSTDRLYRSDAVKLLKSAFAPAAPAGLPVRMRVTQPSSLQPLHALDGTNVLAIPEYGNTMRIYFLSGDVISQQASRLSLSEGWRS